MAERYLLGGANAEAALAVSRALAAKLHDLGVLSDADLEDIRRWALADLDTSATVIAQNGAKAIIAKEFP